MKNMLDPLNIDRERAAYTKIEQYNSGAGSSHMVVNSHGNYGAGGVVHLAPSQGSQSNKLKQKAVGIPPGGHPQNSYDQHP